jgi:hypothetical protein
MGTIPFSNPAGNNQTNSGPPGVSKSVPLGNIPGSPTQGNNPYIPVTPGLPVHAMGTPGAIPAAAPPGASVPNVGGLTTTGQNIAGDTGGLQKQLVDIYGKGVGGALANLLANMSGTDSTVLQEFIKSLQPQMATAQANTNAALGAGGVSANSSVAAIADSNLQAQEFAAISGESAKLTQSQEELTAQLLSGMQGAAQKEVSTSAWSTFADVINNITGDIGNITSGGSFKTPGNTATPAAAPMMPGVNAASQLPSFAPTTDYQSAPTSELDGLDLSGAGW